MQMEYQLVRPTASGMMLICGCQDLAWEAPLAAPWKCVQTDVFEETGDSRQPCSEIKHNFLRCRQRRLFEELREAIIANNGYVVGTFSYADIVMTVAANTIDPVGPPISK